MGLNWRSAGAISSGIAKAQKDYETIESMRLQNEQQKKSFDIDYKMKQMQLDKAEMDKTLDPIRLDNERYVLGLQKKKAATEYELLNVQLNDAQSKIKTKVEKQIEKAKAIADLRKTEAETAAQLAIANDPSIKLNQSPMYVAQLNKSIDNLVQTNADYALRFNKVDESLKAVDRLPSGAIGKISMQIKRNLDPNNPIHADWITLKDTLMDLQLSKVERTKGSISDSEWSSFQQAVGNDDLNLVYGNKKILNAYKEKLKSMDDANRRSFTARYGEDRLDMSILKPLEINESAEDQNGVEMVDANGNRALVDPKTMQVIKEL